MLRLHRLGRIYANRCCSTGFFGDISLLVHRDFGMVIDHFPFSAFRRVPPGPCGLLAWAIFGAREGFFYL